MTTFQTTLQTFLIQSPAQLSVHIKSLRKARGLTQAALGERIGVKQVRMADIENNPASVSLDQLLQVLHALDSRLLLMDTQRYAAHTPAPAPTVQSPSADW
jgi:HTH-type transcriptional regulator / antitoxin HipB